MKKLMEIFLEGAYIQEISWEGKFRERDHMIQLKMLQLLYMELYKVVEQEWEEQY